ncbi:hypothetical protein HS088_TW07G00673 [Tripterygium wilfordii]|uniref:Uncharacterized protein n=1 Tax=Tripterygium wilfordii TaxID=458696 RepID=A0A7J7DFI4_TRIWF|nr:protein AGENET DOMAIN (AGD)-CONTAINING P1-like isoform X1 [Tripterygium wilfordii]KAF5745092.1 hypothetical protein HS088_TW07G00673 [Tripterygium wilfordii]
MESQFPIGAPVEITSDDVGHRGALFLGKIVSPVSYDNKFEVEYETKMNETGQPLRKRVHVGLLRPPQPSETDRDFEFGDLVDAFFVGAWWEGSITKVLDDSRYVVYFRSVRSEFEIRKSNMRLHRELVKGNWVSHLQNQGKASAMEEKVGQTMKTRNFREGTLVEVSSNEDGFQGSRFVARIVKELGNCKFMIEYQCLTTEDDGELLMEKAHIKHIRPIPPRRVVQGFKLNEKVDALYNDGWWEGEIINVLPKNFYIVYFEGTNEQLKFHLSKLRPHLDWIEETWVTPCKRYE